MTRRRISNFQAVEASTARVQHVPVLDRSLVNIAPDDGVWFLNDRAFTEWCARWIDVCSIEEPPIVWAKPPPSCAPERVERAVEAMRKAGVLVRVLPADRVNPAPRPSTTDARMQELQVSDARACCAELARELSTREGVDVKAVMDAVEQSLSAAGI
jgi:hypothetical protein